MSEKISPFDWVNSVSHSKNNILNEHPDIDPKSYPGFIVNKALSYHLDTIFYANEINRLSAMIPQKYQYLSLLYMLKPRKRFAKWVKKDKLEYLEDVKKFYNYNTVKAEEAINILNQEQLDEIREYLHNGNE